MKPTKNAAIPRRKTFWVRRRHHMIVKLTAALLSIDPWALIVEEALDEWLDRRPDVKAKILAMMGEDEREKGTGG